MFKHNYNFKFYNFQVEMINCQLCIIPSIQYLLLHKNQTKKNGACDSVIRKYNPRPIQKTTKTKTKTTTQTKTKAISKTQLSYSCVSGTRLRPRRYAAINDKTTIQIGNPIALA